MNNNRVHNIGYEFTPMRKNLHQILEVCQLDSMKHFYALTHAYQRMNPPA